MTKKNSNKGRLHGIVTDPADLATTMDDLVKNPPEELSERQRRIVNYQYRGLTQKAIAQLEDVSQPYISAQIKKIREVYKSVGRTIDQEVVVGETVSVYGEVEQRAWELYFKHKDTTPSAANKALDTVMTSREKTVKLFMDLGIMNRKAIEHEHTVKAVPFLEQFENMKEEAKQAELQNVIEVSLTTLEEPEPPQLEADIEDAVIEEDDDGV